MVKVTTEEALKNIILNADLSINEQIKLLKGIMMERYQAGYRDGWGDGADAFSENI